MYVCNCGEPRDFELAVTGANPNFQSSPEYKRNCQRCVIAFEMRRRGYPVIAMPNPFTERSGTSAHSVFSGSECFLDVTKKIFLVEGSDSHSLRSAFIEYVKTFPLNSRWAISWRHPDIELSHIIIGEMENSGFKFGDPQIGLIGSDALKLANPVYGYKYFRMDDRALNPTFEWGELIKKEIQK